MEPIEPELGEIDFMNLETRTLDDANAARPESVPPAPSSPIRSKAINIKPDARANRAHVGAADDHPTSAMGEDDYDPMDQEQAPSEDSFVSSSPVLSTSPMRRRTPRSTKSRYRRVYNADVDSEDFIVNSDNDDMDEELSGPTFDEPMRPAALVLTPEEQEELDQVHLGASKSPIMEALVYCALRGWGLHLVKNEPDDIRFRIDDFDKYYRCSAYICSKQNPTDDQSSRIKALKRWFPDFPTRRDHDLLYESAFEVQVQRGKDNKPKKMRAIIDSMKQLVDAEAKNKARKRTR